MVLVKEPFTISNIGFFLRKRLRLDFVGKRGFGYRVEMSAQEV